MSARQREVLWAIVGFLAGIVSLWAAVATIQSLPDGPDDPPPYGDVDIYGPDPVVDP